MSVTAQLCEKIISTRFEDLPQPVVAAAKRLFLDGVAVGIAGTREEPIQILADYYRERKGVEVAGVLGMGFRTATTSAAAINGAAMHVLDFEPMWSPSNHALSTTLPAVLAISEARGATGKDILTALVLGCEIQGRLRVASNQLEHKLIRFHPPGMIGPMSAVVGSARIMGLNADRLAHAFGIVSSRAGSVLGNIGTMTKSTHCGHAAAAGVESVELAARGFTGNTETFDASQGYARSFFGDFYDPLALLKFGESYRIVDPGYAIKLFPSQYGTHFAITAALEARALIALPEDIRSVRVRMPVLPYTNRPEPATGLEGKFSVQYTTACALIDGRVGIGTFTDARLASADVQGLLPRISLEMSEDIPARFDQMSMEVTLDLADGSTVRTVCKGPRGIWGSAAITDEEHGEKIRGCLATRFHPQRVEKLIETIRDLDRLGREDITVLLGMLSTPDF